MRHSRAFAPRAAVRAMPQDREAECAVLGALLVNGRLLTRIGDRLQAADFYDRRHEAIFAAIAALDSRSEPVDIITVADEMRRLGTMAVLAASGSEAYLAGLANGDAGSEHLAHWANLIADKARLRALIIELQERVAEAYAGEHRAEEVIAKAMASVNTVQNGGGRPGYQHRRMLLHAHATLMHQRYTNKQAVTGVPTGLSDFDEKTAGLQPGELVIVAARPSMGKSALAQSWAEHAAGQHSIPTLILSLEMSKESLLDRALASEASVEMQRLRTGFLEPADWQRLTRAYSRMAKAPIAIDERQSPSLAEVRAVCRRWRSDPQFFGPFAEGDRPPLGLIVIDYLQLMRGGGKARDDAAREREIAEISRGLKALAKELHVPVVALSQLNRSLESRADKRPLCSDLRESGAIEQDADLITFIYRDEVYNKNTDDKGVAELIIAKQRNGPTGTVRVSFDGRFVAFRELAENRTEADYQAATAPTQARPRPRAAAQAAHH